MSKQISDRELLEIADTLIARNAKNLSAVTHAREAMQASQDAYVSSMNALAYAVAASLDIRVVSDADWVDAEYPLVGFNPSRDKQRLPDVLKDYDTDGEWDN